MPEYDLQLNKGYVDRVEIETDGTKAMDPLGVVRLGSNSKGANYKWVDEDADREANLRIWGSAALIGIGASMLIEAFRVVLDGSAPKG